MIRSTKHSVKFANINKIDRLQAFIAEYRKVGQQIIDQIWANGYESFNIQQQTLNCPKYLDYKVFSIDTPLSARALSSLCTQICGCLSASTKKHKQVLYVKEKLTKENKPIPQYIDRLIARYKVVKPNFLNCNPELSSKCCDLQPSQHKFGYFLRLKSLGKSFGHIKLPIQHTSRSIKWKSKRGTLLNSFLIAKRHINLRWQIETNIANNKHTKIVGIDQGYNTVATISDGQITPMQDLHGHSLKSVINKLSRKRKSSKAFGKAQAHRKNFINWSINQLDLSNIKEVRLEKIWNIFYKKRTSRKLSHWTNTLIRDKIKRTCEELEVPVIEQDSSYRSQRCSRCGLVRKANRKGKIYKCKSCGHESDADLNASLNHVVDLPGIDWKFRGQRYNLGAGFYWKATGLFRIDGQELRVPVSKN